MIRTLTLIVLIGSPALADTVIAARTIPAKSIIGADDLLVRDIEVAGALEQPSLAVGLEARVALYAGRPIRPGDIGPPSIIERNQIVSLVYKNGSIMISTEGRALDRAAPGDIIRVMNLSSRTTVNARIDANGTAVVTQ